MEANFIEIDVLWAAPSTAAKSHCENDSTLHQRCFSRASDGPAETTLASAKYINMIRWVLHKLYLFHNYTNPINIGLLASLDLPVSLLRQTRTALVLLN